MMRFIQWSPLVWIEALVFTSTGVRRHPNAYNLARFLRSGKHVARWQLRRQLEKGIYRDCQRLGLRLPWKEATTTIRCS